MPSPIRVLHVEDEPDLADLVATFLQRQDERFQVDHAVDADAGLDRLANDIYDCVVSDYEMPGRNGIEFLEAVRERSPDLPFILFTGKGDERVASNAIAAGVTDYLQKGTGSEQYELLANRITNAVEGHRSRQVLAERNEELRIYERIFNTMQGGACLYDREGRFEIVNDYLVDFYDTSRAELEGSRSGLVERIREESEGDPYRELLDGDRVLLQGEIEMEQPDGDRVVSSYRLTPLSIDGTVAGVVAVARDVTERAERERELRDAREEYAELIDGMNDTAWVIDTEGSFRAVNDAAVETLGYTRSELRSMRPQDIDAALEDQEIDQLIGDMPEDEKQVFETVHETADGTQIPVEISSSLITYHGETAILSVGRDIRDRKERERRLEEFASVVSHDLRNPLTVARGHLERAREAPDEEHFAAIDRAHERMERLIEDLLAISRWGDRAHDPEPVALGELVEACWGIVHTPEATLEVDVEPRITADRGRVKQLVENLLRNAIEHAGEDATVRIGGLPDGFYVEDDGPGIPAAERERIFEAGYSATADGTGFGLSIVEDVADAHGWSVSMTEGPDGGARFEVTGVEDADR